MTTTAPAPTFGPAEPAAVDTLRVGDFVERTLPFTTQGVRGKITRYRATLIDSAVKAISEREDQRHELTWRAVYFVRGGNVVVPESAKVIVRRRLTDDGPSRPAECPYCGTATAPGAVACADCG